MISLSTFAIFNHVGAVMILRWIHIAVGLAWVGSFAYLLLIQQRPGSFKNPDHLSSVLPEHKKLVGFATITVVSGALMLALSWSMSFYSSWGLCILLGSLLGLLMWAHLTFVIGPLKMTVFQKCSEVFTGSMASDSLIATPLPKGVDGLLQRIHRFSRFNILLAVPLLFFMAAASHLGIEVNPLSNPWLVWGILVAILTVLEVWVLSGKGPRLNSNKVAVGGGVLLWAVLYTVIELTTK